MSNKNQSRIDRVMKKRRRILLKRILLFSSILGMCVAIYFIVQLWGVFAKGHDELAKSKLRENQVNLEKDPFAILLIGSDARKEGSHNWRPDVLIVAAINPKKKTMKMVSIPRDSWVEIANTNGGKSKINHAAFYGHEHGVDPVQNTRETVEQFLHIPIDHYAKVNFKGFMDTIDGLGGIEVNNQREFSMTSFGGKKLHFPKGRQHLNGEQALAYARMRKQDPLGDKGRNIRQQEVLNEIMKKMVSFQGISQFKDLSDKVGENVSYSVKLTDIVPLMSIYDNIPKSNIETITIQTTSERREGQAVEIISEEEQKRVSQIFQKQLEWTPKNDPFQSDQENDPESKEQSEEKVSTVK